MSFGVFLASCHMRGYFTEADMWDDVLLSTDTWYFSGNQPGKRTCDVLLVGMLERTCDVWKGFKYNPTDRG